MYTGNAFFCVLRVPNTMGGSFGRSTEPSLDLSLYFPCRSSQLYARKFELGIVFEGQHHDGTNRIFSYNMFRAACAEFVGMVISLFNGKEAAGKSNL